jgi:hypothetical protein
MVSEREALNCPASRLMIKFDLVGFANATDPTTVGYLKKCFPGGPYDYHTRVTNLWNTMLKGYPEPDYISISELNAA